MGDGYPDIELLPNIANYFGVTIDALLGNDKTDDAVREEYRVEFDKFWYDDDYEGGLNLALEHYRRYPRSKYIDDYAYHVCLLIISILEKYPDDDGVRAKYMPLLKEVSERNIRESTDQTLRKNTIAIMCENCDDADFDKWHDMCVDEYFEVKREVLEERYWRRGKYAECRLRHDVNNLYLVLHFLFRALRNWETPERAAEDFKERIRILEFFGENGEVPTAWQGYYAELHFRVACGLFGCGSRDEGYNYLDKAFELYRRWFDVPMGAELEFGKKIIFGGVKTVKGKDIILLPDGTEEPLLGEGSRMTVQDNELLYNCMTYPYGWEWLDPVRDDEKFKEYVEKALYYKENFNPTESETNEI